MAQSAPQTDLLHGPRFHIAVGGMLLIAVICGIYYPSLNGGFLLDDDLLLTQNKLIHQSDGLYRIWFTTEPTDYWPLTNTTLWLEWRVWGNSPNGYRIMNLVLHIIDVLLLWTVLSRLAIPGAFLAALLFAVHPVNVESVAWIAQLKNLLALLFCLLSVLWWLRGEETREAGDEGRGPKEAVREGRDVPKAMSSPIWNRWYLLCIVAFLAAMLSKGSVAILPLVLLLLAWWQRRLTKVTIAKTIPLFLIAGGLTIVNIWFQSHDMQQVVRHASFLERLLEAGATIWFYLWKAILPVQLAFVYPQWHINTADWRWWLPLIAALATTGLLWSNRKTSLGRALLLAWAFFCIALLPVMGFTDVTYMKWSLVADHYQHVALIAVVSLSAAGLEQWWRNTQPGKRWLPIGAAGAFVVVLAILTGLQSALYRNAALLYGAAADQNSQCAMLYNELGNALVAEGRYPEAIGSFQQALRVQADDVDALDNLGLALMNSGRKQEALSRFQEALRINPNDATVHSNLGYLFVNDGELSQAAEQFQQAVTLQPDRAEIRCNLGTAFLRAGQYQAAIDAYQSALQIDRHYVPAQQGLFAALAKSGQIDKAMKLFPQAFEQKSNPDGATGNSRLSK